MKRLVLMHIITNLGPYLYGLHGWGYFHGFLAIVGDDHVSTIPIMHRNLINNPNSIEILNDELIRI